MQRWMMMATVGLFATSWIVKFEPAPYDVLMVAFAALLLSGKLVRIPKDHRWALMSLGLFVAANVLSVLFSKSLPRAVFSGAVTMYLVGTWLLLISVRPEHHGSVVKAIFGGYCIAATLAALTGVLGSMHVIPLANQLTYGGIRAQSLFKDPNVFGPFLVPMVLYALDRANRNQGKQLWGWVILAGLLATGVVLSFSRGAWLNFIVAMVVFLSLYRIRPWTVGLKNAVVAAIISLGILGLAIVTRPEIPQLLIARTKLQQYDHNRFGNQMAIAKSVTPGVSESTSTTPEAPQGDSNSNSHKDSVSQAHNDSISETATDDAPKVSSDGDPKATPDQSGDVESNQQTGSAPQADDSEAQVDTDLDKAETAPPMWYALFGRGPGQSEVWFGMSPHNLYLRVWFENGIVGLIGLLALIAVSLGNLYAHSRSGSNLATVTLASIVGILVNSLFIDTHHWRHFWLLLAIPWLLTGGRESWDWEATEPVDFQLRRGDGDLTCTALHESRD